MKIIPGVAVIAGLYSFSAMADQKIILGTHLEQDAQHTISETPTQVVVKLGRNVKGFNQIWQSHPYPILSIEFSVDRKDCQNIFRCATAGFISIAENHIVSHFSTVRTARAKYQVQEINSPETGGKQVEFLLLFENEQGKAETRSFVFEPNQVSFEN
jgi:hypothetical protein